MAWDTEALRAEKEEEGGRRRGEWTTAVAELCEGRFPGFG